MEIRSYAGQSSMLVAGPLGSLKARTNNLFQSTIATVQSEMVFIGHIAGYSR